MRTRPTLRCLKEDLHIPLPPINDPLDEIDHPLIVKVNNQFAHPDTTHEKYPWLVAAGQREEGSRHDFYDDLSQSAPTARAHYNATHTPALTTDTHTAAWLPTENDHQRYELEAGIRLRREIKSTVENLVRTSLLDGHEHTAQLSGSTISVLIRANEGHETYVALRITGPVPTNFLITILDLVPGCDRETWYPEFALPHRILTPGEQVWSDLMEPNAAAKILDDSEI